MPRAYSTDLRQRIVAHVLDNGARVSDTATTFAVSERTVQKYLGRWYRTGNVEPAGRERLGRKRVLSAVHIAVRTGVLWSPPASPAARAPPHSRAYGGALGPSNR